MTFEYTNHGNASQISGLVNMSLLRLKHIYKTTLNKQKEKASQRSGRNMCNSYGKQSVNIP